FIIYSFFLIMSPLALMSILFPYTTLFRSVGLEVEYEDYCYLVNVNFMNVWEYVYKDEMVEIQDILSNLISEQLKTDLGLKGNILDRKSTRLNSSHVSISYAVFCLKKKNVS